MQIRQSIIFFLTIALAKQNAGGITNFAKVSIFVRKIFLPPRWATIGNLSVLSENV